MSSSSPNSLVVGASTYGFGQISSVDTIADKLHGTIHHADMDTSGVKAATGIESAGYFVTA